jgi:hypothetical protein
MMKIKIRHISFIIFIILSFIGVIILSSRNIDLPLLKVGYFGKANNFLAMLQLVIIPLFIYLCFALKNKIAQIIFILLTATMYTFRGFSLITLLNQSNNSIEESRSDLNTFFYISLLIILFLTALGLLLKLMKNKDISRMILKVNSILGIVLSGFMFLMFLLFMFVMDVDKKPVAVLSFTELVDLITYIFILLSVKKEAA